MHQPILRQQSMAQMSLRYPILLVHGLALRDDLPLFRYWGRLPGFLRTLGNRVHLSRHDAWASVEENAHFIKQRIEEILQKENCPRINIIAHSKGGIESRRSAHLFGKNPPISSIVTIASPHRGAALADWLLRFRGSRHEKVHNLVNLFSRLIGDRNPNSLMALNQLTSRSMEAFNQRTQDLAGIHYLSVASRLRRPVLDPLVLVSHRILWELEGENDGVVGTENCRWGDSFTLWGQEKGLSHIDVCDMSGFKRRGFDIRDAYSQLLGDLKSRGA